MQHTTGASSFRSYVAGATRRSSRHQATRRLQQRPRRSHVADFGICVDSRWKNRGVASALMREMIEMCDNWLRVDRIELTVFVDNAPAIKVYKKYGFEIEGTGKKYALRNGEYVDAYYMARVK